MATQSQGALALLIVIPVVWVIWLWVCLPYSRKKNLTHPTDDRLETRHSDPHLPNILQLSRNGLLRECRQLSG